MRLDFNLIENWIAPKSHILDLGCGDGTLMAQLQSRRQVTGYGLEIDPKQISHCVDKGVNVIQQNLDQGLDNFSSNSFDTVVMTQAIQTLANPHLVLQEMLRVGKECIVTFPNFGHWKARLHLALNGRMPVSDLLPYEWYDTPNIHFCTFKDFEVLCSEFNITIKHREVVTQTAASAQFKELLPNLLGVTAIYHLTK